MMEILNQVTQVANTVLLILGGLTVAATVIVRLTPTKADDEAVEGFKGLWLKALSFLPTLGVNPQTKALQNALEALKEDKTV